MNTKASRGHLDLLCFVFMLAYLPSVSMLTVPEIRGWHAGSLHVMKERRLDIRQRQQQGDDVNLVTLNVANLHQCLRMCWLYTSCGVVNYFIRTSGSSKPLCQLYKRDSHRSVKVVSDSNAMIVNMTRAVVKKERLLGCDRRPCKNNELCINVRTHDNYMCLPQGSMTCGAPSVEIENAIFTTDGLGNAYYRCKDGFAPTPDGVVQSQCDKATGRWSSVSLTCQYVNCGPPPELEGADVRYTGYDFEAVSIYSCRTGRYSQSENNMNVQCLRSGHWSDAPSPCILVDCGQPKAVDHGKVELPAIDIQARYLPDMRTFYKGTATHTCLTGYESPLPSFQSTCENTGQWSITHASFYCNPVDCGLPPAFDFTNQNGTSTTYQSNVSYSCVDGYYMSNDPGEDVIVTSSQCQHDGSWSSINIFCLPVDCGRLPDLPDIDASSNSTTLGSIASLKCSNDSHLFKGSDQLTCNTSGLWSESNAFCIAPPCSTPMSVANSTVTVQMVDGDDVYIAIYRSLPGFIFNTGEATQLYTCVDGSWKGFPDLQSLPISCGNPPTIAYAEASAPSRIYRSSATYTCVTGFRNATVFNQITCLENGTWSQEKIECSKITCESPPPFVDNSRSSMNLSIEYGYGDNIVIQCDDGFSLKSSSDTAFCKETGWEMSDIECVRNECGHPPSVTNSTFVIQGDQVLYSCDEGFALMNVNVSKKTCNGTGWSEEEVACVLDRCSHPPEVENATSIFNSTARGSSVTYKCKDGYRFDVGAPYQRVCQENRVWSTENIVCRPSPTDCGTTPSIPNTNVTNTNGNVGSTVDYRCQAGYKLSSDVPSTVSSGSTFISRIQYPATSPQTDNSIIWTATCDASGEWSSDDARPEGCDPVDCGEPPRLDHAHLELPISYTFGNEVVYSCVTGFRLKSAQLNKKTCGETGIWEGDVECKIIECPDYEANEGMTVGVEGRKPGDAMIYTCSYSHEHWWFDRTICLENGTWSKPRIECHLIDCGSPPDLEHATVSYTTTTYKSTASYSCQYPYVQLLNWKQKICLSKGWRNRHVQCKHVTETTCRTITKGDNILRIDYTNFTDGGLAVHICNEGYRIRSLNNDANDDTGNRLDESSRVCTSGAWSGENIVCDPVDCRSYPEVRNARAIEGSTTFQSEVVYECSPEYIMPGPSSKRCMENGRWSDDPVECFHRDSVYCLSPPMKINSIVYYKSHAVGAEAEYVCIEGFVGNVAKTECLNSGYWSSLVDFNCVPIDCRRPPMINNTAIHVHATTFGHHAIYTCSMYSQDEDRRPSRSQCQANGTWSSVESPCFHCYPPSQPSDTLNQSYTKHLYGVGDVITYKCDVGYVPFPQNTRIQMTCGRGGTWSLMETESYCIPQTCMVDTAVFDPRHIVVLERVDSSRGVVTGHYRCMNGFFILGRDYDAPAEVVCDFAAGWLPGYILPCITVDCGKPISIANAIPTENRTTYLSEVTYTCDVMYVPLGSIVTTVCQQNGMWSPVNLTCTQCSMDVVFKNGRLTNYTDETSNSESVTVTQQQQQQQQQQAYIDCDENHLLYSNVSLASHVVTCVKGDAGTLEWDNLDSLQCVRNEWTTPITLQDIRLDQSYPFYNICSESKIDESQLVRHYLLSYQGGKAVPTLIVQIDKGISTIQLIQTSFTGEEIVLEVTENFKNVTSHRICLGVFPENITYKVWVDGHYVGMMDYTIIPVSQIAKFRVDGWNHKYFVTHLEILV